MTQCSIRAFSLLLMRVMLSGIFFIAGTNHLLLTDKIVGRLQNAALKEFALFLGPPDLLVVTAGIFMLIGGLALLSGFLTRWAAIGLLLIVVPITITIQIGQWATAGPLFKNIAMMGALLFFAINGSVRYGMDQFIFQNQQNTSI